MLRREGAEPRTSENFYRKVFQAVLLSGSETWVLTAEMLKKLKGVHMGFLWQVTGMKARRLGDKNWRKEGAERVVQAAGNKTLWE